MKRLLGPLFALLLGLGSLLGTPTVLAASGTITTIPLTPPNEIPPYPYGLARSPNGSLYVTDSSNHMVKRISPNGAIVRVVGNPGETCYPTAPCGDGGPADKAQLTDPTDVALGVDGSLYIADIGSHRVRRVRPDNIITTVAGNGSAITSGDGGPAIQAGLATPSTVAPATDGSLYIGDPTSHVVRRVAPDGIITTVIGTGQQCYPNTLPCGDNGAATQAQLAQPDDLLLGPDGSLYIGDGGRVRRVTNGSITTIAGGCDLSRQECTGGSIPTRTQLGRILGMDLGPDGSLYLADYGLHLVWQFRQGIISVVAGNGQLCTRYDDPCGDGGPATAAKLGRLTAVAVQPDRTLFTIEYGGRLRRVTPPAAPPPAAAPTSLAITNSTESSIALVWQDNATNEDGYLVERLRAGDTWTPLVMLPAERVSYTDTALSPDTPICYRVQAQNAGGFSPYSNQVCGRTLPRSTARSLLLNGTNAYVNVPNSASLNLTGLLTIEAWVKTSVNKPEYQAIMARAGAAPNEDGGYALYLADGMLRFYISKNSSTSAIVYGQRAVADGQWHHVAGVADGAELRIYVDGQLDTAISQPFAPAPGTTSLTIGVDEYLGTLFYPFQGQIDEVRVSAGARYPTPFTFTPETTLSCDSGPGFQTRGVWSFDGASVRDGCNTNPAQSINAPSFSTDVPRSPEVTPLAPGEYQLCLNGSTAFVDVPSSVSLNLTGPLTIEAWVKTSVTKPEYQAIMARAGAAPNEDGGYGLYLADGMLRFAIFKNSSLSSYVVGQRMITDGAWHHVAGVADGAELRIYVDGQLDATHYQSFAPAAGTTSLTIGADEYLGTLFYPFQGAIDNVRVSAGARYTQVFTPEPVPSLDNTTRGLWTFSDASFRDSSTNGNDGRGTGGAAFC